MLSTAVAADAAAFFAGVRDLARESFFRRFGDLLRVCCRRGLFCACCDVLHDSNTIFVSLVRAFSWASAKQCHRQERENAQGDDGNGGSCVVLVGGLGSGDSFPNGLCSCICIIKLRAQLTERVPAARSHIHDTISKVLTQVRHACLHSSHAGVRRACWRLGGSLRGSLPCGSLLRRHGGWLGHLENAEIATIRRKSAKQTR